MFPEGSGLIALSVGKLLPFLPHAAYTLLEGLGMAATLIWYWRWGRERPEAAIVLAVLPLFLAWRSLPSYFDFCALPLALLLSAYNGGETLAPGKTPGRKVVTQAPVGNARDDMCAHCGMVESFSSLLQRQALCWTGAQRARRRERLALPPAFLLLTARLRANMGRAPDGLLPVAESMGQHVYWLKSSDP
jgi:hypothetical protein